MRMLPQCYMHYITSYSMISSIIFMCDFFHGNGNFSKTYRNNTKYCTGKHSRHRLLLNEHLHCLPFHMHHLDASLFSSTVQLHCMITATFFRYMNFSDFFFRSFSLFTVQNYRKFPKYSDTEFPKFSDTQKICCNHSKI